MMNIQYNTTVTDQEPDQREQCEGESNFPRFKPAHNSTNYRGRQLAMLATYQVHKIS